jgi:hypothetical protein
MEPFSFDPIKTQFSNNLVVNDTLNVVIHTFDQYNNPSADMFQAIPVGLTTNGSATKPALASFVIIKNIQMTTYVEIVPITNSVAEVVAISLVDSFGSNLIANDTQTVQFYLDKNFVIDNTTTSANVGTGFTAITVRILNRAGNIINEAHTISIVATGSAVVSSPIGGPVVTFTRGAGIFFVRNQIAQTVVLSIVDPSNTGISSASTLEFTFIDPSPPVIIGCPRQSEITVSTDPELATAIVSWPNIVANAINSTITSRQYITNPSGLQSGSAFPVGRSSVEFIAFNTAGSNASCLFFVTVEDHEPPRVTCPASFTQRCNPPLNHTDVTWIQPTASDNVAVSSFSISRQPGDYAAGIYTVNAVANDTSGNMANCSFIFTVLTDTIPPTVSCPPSMTVPTDLHSSNAKVDWEPPQVTDEFEISNSFYMPSQYTPPAVFPLGTTTVNFTATNVWLLSTTCNFTITVADTELPQITCPASFTVQLDFAVTSVVVSWEAPVATDNVAVDVISQNLTSGSILVSGSYTVVASAKDTAGNVSPQCSFMITVLPAFCPPGSWWNKNLIRNIECNNCAAGTWSSIQGATSVDACVNCAMGTYSSVSGSSTACIDCNQGSWSSVLASNSSSSCTLCNAGTWSSVHASNSTAGCVNCIAGSWSRTIGAASQTTCQAGIICL